MSVWKSGERLFIFTSLISPSKIILFEKQYQVFDTVFHLVMKHCVSCLKIYTRAPMMPALMHIFALYFSSENNWIPNS